MLTTKVTKEHEGKTINRRGLAYLR